MPALCPVAVGSAERTPVFVGIDSHKDTLAVAVIDGGGRAVTVRQLPNDAAGFTALTALAAEHRVERVGIEGSTNFGWAAAMHLIEAAVTVVEVPPLLTSRRTTVPAGTGQDRPGRRGLHRPDHRPGREPAGSAADGRAAGRSAGADGLPRAAHRGTHRDRQPGAHRSGLAPARLSAPPPPADQPAHLRAALELLENDSAFAPRSPALGCSGCWPSTPNSPGYAADRRPGPGQRHTLTGIYGVGPFVAATILGRRVGIGRYPPGTPSPPPTAPHRSRPPAGAPSGTGSTAAATGSSTGALHDRDHPDPRRDRGPRLLRTQTRRRQDRREALRCLKRRLSDVVYRPCARPPQQPQPHCSPFPPGRMTRPGGGREVGNGARLTAWRAARQDSQSRSCFFA